MMMCRTARRWMYLYRPDELSEFRKHRLDQHLARCPQCAAEAEVTPGVERTIANVRTQTPVLDDPKAFTLMVMRAVRREDLRSGGAVARAREWRPGFRVAQWTSGAALVAVTIAFVALIVPDARKVTLLEARLRQSSGFSVTQEPGAGEILRRIPFDGLRRGDIHKAELFNRWSPFDALNELGLFSRGRQEEFLKHISSNYPQLASINVEDGLDDRERAVLATEGAALMRELESIISREGTLDEK